MFTFGSRCSVSQVRRAAVFAVFDVSVSYPATCSVDAFNKLFEAMHKLFGKE